MSCGAELFYEMDQRYLAHDCRRFTLPCARCGAMLCRHWGPVGCPRCLKRASKEWINIVTNYDHLVERLSSQLRKANGPLLETLKMVACRYENADFEETAYRTVLQVIKDADPEPKEVKP